MGVIASLIIGAIAGWLGGTIYKGSGLSGISSLVFLEVAWGIGFWVMCLIFHLEKDGLALS